MIDGGKTSKRAVRLFDVLYESLLVSLSRNATEFDVYFLIVRPQRVDESRACRFLFAISVSDLCEGWKVYSRCQCNQRTCRLQCSTLVSAKTRAQILNDIATTARRWLLSTRPKLQRYDYGSVGSPSPAPWWSAPSSACRRVSLISYSCTANRSVLPANTRYLNTACPCFRVWIPENHPKQVDVCKHANDCASDSTTLQESLHLISLSKHNERRGVESR